jgi:ABC-2 type transport system ATP-binding protein
VPQSGTARVLGWELQSQRAALRRRLGVVFQAPALDRKLTVRENLRHQGHLYGLRGAALRRRVDAELQRFGLLERGGDLVQTLSGGLARRVELAKCLLHEPDLLVLDEPSTGLDPGARLELWRSLEEIRRDRGVTVLLTSHILEEAERCDRVAILDGGALVACGAPLALKAHVGDDVITMAARDPARLAAGVVARFAIAPRVVDASVRIEHGGDAALLPRLVEAFADQILSLTLSKPTFEDVFIHFTGHAFEDGAAVERKAVVAAARSRGTGVA